MVSMDDAKWGFSVSGSYHVMHNRESGTNEITWLPSPLLIMFLEMQQLQTTMQEKMAHSSYPSGLFIKTWITKELERIYKLLFQWEQGIVTATLDYTISSVNAEQYGVEAGSWLSGWDTTSMTINPNGAVTSAFVNGTYFDGGIFNNNFKWANDDTNNKSVGLNLEFRVTDDLYTYS
jgi:hypothetical protein